VVHTDDGTASLTANSPARHDRGRVH